MSHVLADMSEGADVESEHRDQTPAESDFCLTTIRSRVRSAKVLFWKSYSSERCYLLIFPKTTFEKLVGLISKLRWNEIVRELNEKHLSWTYFWVFVLILRTWSKTGSCRLFSCEHSFHTMCVFLWNHKVFSNICQHILVLEEFWIRAGELIES